MKTLSIFSLFLCLLSSFPSHASEPLPIVQGFTNRIATQFAILYEGNISLEVYATAKGTNQRHIPLFAETRTFPNSAAQVLHYRFSGLSPDEEYTLQIKQRDGTELDARTFRTLKLEKKSVRFAVASCMDDSFENEQEGMWNALLGNEPELIFLIGDNVYATKGVLFKGVGASPPHLWERYTEMRKKLTVYRAKKLTPIFATWDDNDYGMNDGDRTFVNRIESTKIFNAFFPQSALEPELEGGPGVATLFTGFGHRFFLTDDRSFRSEPKVKEDTHWGEAQEKWMFDAIKSDKTPTWILNGDQFFGGYHKYESLQGSSPKAFKRFLKAMKASIAPVALISGDRHLTELMRIPASETGFETYELTTSPLHAKVYPEPWEKTPNPLKIAGQGSINNFAIINSVASVGSLKFKASVYGPKNKLLFEKELEVRR